MQDGKIENKVVNLRRQIVFDGSNDENWSLRSTLTNTCSFRIDGLIGGLAVDRNKCLCSHFTMLFNDDTDTEHARNGSSNYATTFIIFIDKTKATTVEELKTWLSNNPITVEYELATLDETAFTSTQLAQYRKLCEAFPNGTNLNDYLV